MSKRIAAVVATSAAFVGVIIGAPTASAEPNPRDCPQGNVCVFYSSTTTDGPAAIKSAGNWNGSHTIGRGGGTIFNNGAPQPGSDHIQATWTYNGRTWGKCLHNNPGPGDYKYVLSSDVTLTSLVWRGECDE